MAQPYGDGGQLHVYSSVTLDHERQSPIEDKRFEKTHLEPLRTPDEHETFLRRPLEPHSINASPQQSPQILMSRSSSFLNIHQDSIDQKHDQISSAIKPDFHVQVQSISRTDSFSRLGNSTPPGKNQAKRNGIEWGVNWYQEPAYMIVYAVVGFCLAAVHHILYSFLNGKVAGSQRRQQWAHATGNILAVAIVALLGAANRGAYHQLVWMLLRRKSFKLKTMDGLFSLTSDPKKFFDLEAWRNAPLLVFLGLLCWLVTLAGVLPPGSLNVVPGATTKVSLEHLPAFNWSAQYWATTVAPTALVQDVAAVTAGMQILAFDSHAPNSSNSSFTQAIRGPYLHCDYANETQMEIFDYYQQALLNESAEQTETIYTAKTWPSNWPYAYNQIVANTTNSNLTARDAGQAAPSSAAWSYATGVVLTAFDPYGYYQYESTNKWPPVLPTTFWNSSGHLIPTEALNSSQNFNSVSFFAADGFIRMAPVQLWILTSNETFVCTLGNGTRDVHFSFTSGSQEISYGELYDFEPAFIPSDKNMTMALDNDIGFFGAHQVLANYIQGNVSLELATGYDSSNTSVPDINSSELLEPPVSNIYLTSLDTCGDFNENFWYQKGFVGDTDSFDEKPTNQCRNRTLIRAMEDLWTNFTINLFSSDKLTTPNATPTNITIMEAHNIYEYDRLNLIVPYGVAITLTTISVILGIFAFRINGVSHSSAFSAMLSTTRNPSLDAITEGQSLGAFPLNDDLSRIRLRFGVLEEGSKKRAGFGLENEVRPLKKGDRCI